MAIAYDAEIEAVDAFASDVGSWWNWLSTEQLSFSHFVALSFLVAVVMYALSVFAQYRRAQERTKKARRIGAYIGAEGVTHVSQAVVCTEVVAVGRCPPPAPTPLEYEGTLLHRPVAATPRKHQSSVRLSTSHTASSATLPPSALKDTTAKRKQASVVWADDVFKLAADARQVSATSASAITSTIGAPYDVLPPIGYSLAQDAAPHQSVLQPSSRHHQISSSTDSSDSDREGLQPSPSSQTGRRDNRSRSSSYAQQQRRSSSKENQRLSRRSTAARAARAGKISLLAGNADVMANSVLTKSTVSPTLTASPLAFAASSLPPLHVGASAISTVLDASSVPTRRCVDGAFEAAPPASSSFATGSHRVSVAHGRRSPIAKDDEPVDFSHVYEEDWAKRLGCSAPPRRQHRRESALQDSYAASDDASTSAARGDASTSSQGYPSGLGVFCTTTPPPHSSVTFAPARSTAGAALQAITGLDFTAVERPLPPLIARLPTPPPQPVVTSVQERVSGASTTPSKAIPTLPNVSATRTSTLGFGQRPGAPPPPLAVGGAFQRPSDAPPAVGTVAAPPPSDTIAPAKVEAVAVAASAPLASQSSAATPEPSAADAPTAAPVTDAESTSKSTLDSDGFKVPSPVSRPAVAAPSPTAPPSLPASAPRPPQPFKTLASIPQAPPQRPPRYSDPDDADSGATSSTSTTSSAAAPAGTKTTPPPSFSAAGVRGPFGPTTSPAPSAAPSAAAPSLWGKAPNQSPFPPKGIAEPSGNTSAPSGSLFAGLKPQPSQSPLSALKPALTAPALGVASPWGTQQPSGLPHRSRSSSGGSSSGGGSPRAGRYLSSGGRGGGGGGRGGGGRGGSPNYRGEGSARRRQ